MWRLLFIVVFATSSLVAAPEGQALIFGKVAFAESTLMQITWLEDVMLEKKGQLQADVNPMGEFYLPIRLEKLQKYELYFSGQTIPLYLEPGDRLEINFNAGSLHMAKLSGRGSEKTKVANDLNRLYPYERPAQHTQTPQFSFGYGRNQLEMMQKLSFDNYGKEVDRRKEKKLLALDTLAAEVDSNFRSLLDMEIRAKWAGDVLIFLSTHRDYSYQDFLNKYPGLESELFALGLGEAQYLENPVYIRFLAAYIQFHSQQPYLPTMLPIEDYYELVSTKLSGGLKELLQAKILAKQLKRRNIDFYNSRKTAFEAGIENPWILDELLKLSGEISAFSTGAPATEFELYAADSSLVSLKAFQGQYVFISFWATWCKPCINNFELNKSRKVAWEEKGVQFINIAIKNEREDWLGMINRNENIRGINLLADKEMSEQLQKDYRFSGLPHYIIVDAEGKLLFVKNQNTGDLSKMENELFRLIK